MNLPSKLVGIGFLLALVGSSGAPSAADLRTKTAAEQEDYDHVAMPPGFRVEMSELEGPVFADADGRTLYRWPVTDLRNGEAGEIRGIPSCDDHVYKVNSGLMSPYPPGLTLPEVEARLSCAQVWPPVLAGTDAKPVGRWTILKRPDGKTQWAYDSFALYTSILDHQPGDVWGGTKRRRGPDGPAVREPVGPPPNIPGEFNIIPVATGRLLVDNDGYSVYTSDKDGPEKSNCTAVCLKEWKPVLAPAWAEARGDWTIFEPSPGIKQWAFHKKPLYAHPADQEFRSLKGSDVSGWHNVYAQHAPAPPKEFTIQDTRVGQVLADAHGRTIYVYHCGDDAVDQLACDNPDATQVYRFVVCGGGDPDRCLKTFPYVIAAKNARSENRTWSTMDIDPRTGHRAKPGQAGAVHVWAYRERPVFIFAGDSAPGDINADAWGEFYGHRNGFKAFWLRDDFLHNTE